jgi:dihydroorotate dehydrogenase
MIAKPLLFDASLHLRIFKNVIRPRLYQINGNDPEKVHKYAIDFLNDNVGLLQRNQHRFDFGDKYKVNFYGQYVRPLVVAEGFDKNCELLRPLSCIADVQLPGTITVDCMPGNTGVRLVVDSKNEKSWNAQGFPSNGIHYSLINIESYKENYTDKQSLIVPSICGVPPLDESIPSPKRLEMAYEQFVELSKTFEQYSFGQIWNPASPNTASLPMLRSKETAETYASTLRDILKDRPSFMKVPPMVDERDKETVMNMIEGWREGGGRGVIVNNTRLVNKEQEPHLNDFTYKSAGEGGRDLYPYTKKGVKAVHEKFPDLSIVAEGGISIQPEKRAYELHLLGANMIGSYTSFAINGLGQFIRIANGEKKLMKRDGYDSLEELIEKRDSKLHR